MLNEPADPFGNSLLEFRQSIKLWPPPPTCLSKKQQKKSVTHFGQTLFSHLLSASENDAQAADKGSPQIALPTSTRRHLAIVHSLHRSIRGRGARGEFLPSAAAFYGGHLHALCAPTDAAIGSVPGLLVWSHEILLSCVNL